MKKRIHRLNQWLNRPASVIIVLIVLFAYFAYQNAQFQKNNRTIIEQTQISARNTNTIVGQLKKVLCEDIPDSQCNLSKAVAELKEDTRVKNNIIICMLQVPQPQRIPVEENCRNQAQATWGVMPTKKETVTPQSASPSSQGAASPSKPAPDNNNNNNNNNQTDDPEPKLLDCKVDFLGLHFGCP